MAGLLSAASMLQFTFKGKLTHFSLRDRKRTRFQHKPFVAKSMCACSYSINSLNIQMVGMGDRVCVDLCSIMKPGEGLLVGSFARGLFLVHSEYLESNYICSRPFRVNAGPVHAYVAIPGGRIKSWERDTRCRPKWDAANSHHWSCEDRDKTINPCRGKG